jgi:SAM-dependent methyltransferase
MRTDDDLDAVGRLARNYSGSADGYAEFWSPLIRPVGRWLLESLPWSDADRVLDVGTGTGALVPDIRHFAPAARIVGIDCSLGMLALGACKGAHLAVMDAMNLGLRTAQFDVAVMAFVLFHVPDPIGALAEVKRVLRPGAAVGIVTWADDPEPRAGTIWNEELDAWAAWDPSPQTRREELMNTPEKLAQLLTTVGFAPGRIWVERIEHQWDVARFTGLRTSFGTTKRRLATLEPGRRAAFLERMAKRMAQLRGEDLLYRGVAVCAVATAPALGPTDHST